jgi:hypothetical protein
MSRLILDYDTSFKPVCDEVIVWDRKINRKTGQDKINHISTQCIQNLIVRGKSWKKNQQFPITFLLTTVCFHRTCFILFHLQNRTVSSDRSLPIFFPANKPPLTNLLSLVVSFVSFEPRKTKYVLLY